MLAFLVVALLMLVALAAFLMMRPATAVPTSST